MDPKKLEAFVNKGNKPQGGGGKKGGGEPQPPHEEPEENEHEDGEEEPEGGDELAEKYGDLLEMLEAHATDLEDQCDMLDKSLLTEPGEEDDPEFDQVVKEAVDSLDPALVDLMREKLKGVSWDEAQDLAEHLADEGHIAEPELIGGLLFHAGRVL